MQLDSGKYGHQKKCLITKENGSDSRGEKESTSKQAEPTRVKIFEGGYVTYCFDSPSQMWMAFQVYAEMTTGQ